jgi:hypothetical protein
MTGGRPLPDAAVGQVVKSFSGVAAKRHRARLILGVRTGCRISEMLAIRAGDVYRHGPVVDRVTVPRRHVRGGQAGRAAGRPVT